MKTKTKRRCRGRVDLKIFNILKTLSSAPLMAAPADEQPLMGVAQPVKLTRDMNYAATLQPAARKKHPLPRKPLTYLHGDHE